MKKIITGYLLLFLIAGVLVFLDQWTKELVRTNLPIGTVYRPELWLSQYARILHWKNSGVVLGFFENMGKVIVVLSFVVSAAIIYYFPQVSPKDWLVRISLGMMLGGAVGNLIDRLMQGYVTDFISVGNFPVFNIADASISVGVAVLFVGVLVQERRQRSAKEAISAHQEPEKPSEFSDQSPGTNQGE